MNRTILSYMLLFIVVVLMMYALAADSQTLLPPTTPREMPCREYLADMKKQFVSIAQSKQERRTLKRSPAFIASHDNCTAWNQNFLGLQLEMLKISRVTDPTILYPVVHQSTTGNLYKAGSHPLP